MMKSVNKQHPGYLFLLLCILFCGCTKDEIETMGMIYGIVNDFDNGEPIQNAQIALTPYGKTINTGSDGSYEFTELEPGQYTIQISKSGYKTNTKRISVIAGEKASGDMILQWGTSRIRLSTGSLNFGGQSTSKTFTIRNIGTSGTAVSWSVQTASPVSWLSIEPAGGSTANGKESTVVLNINRERVTKDETVQVLVEAEGESLSLEVSVSKSGSGSDSSGEGTCETITPYDIKLKTEFLQCIKIGSTVEFQFKITNTGDDVTVYFNTSLLEGYDSQGNKYEFNNSELFLSNKRITAGGTSSWLFLHKNPVTGKVVLRNVPSDAFSIARYQVVAHRSAPWNVLNWTMQFDNIRW